MTFEDDRQEKTQKMLRNFLKELKDMPFQSPFIERVKKYNDYYNLMEKIKKAKVEDVIQFIEDAKLK